VHAAVEPGIALAISEASDTCRSNGAMPRLSFFSRLEVRKFRATRKLERLY
jgi:hypothetical protein